VPTVALRTLGCRLNQAESDEILIALADRGIAVDNDDPQILVINTCTVTTEASSASRKLIRRSVKEHPGSKVVVTGCYALAHEDEVRAMAGVDAVLPVKETLPGAVAEEAGAAAVPIDFEGPRRNLRVQTGCDEQCTFCVVPATRGPLDSRPLDEVLVHARRLVDSGAAELVVSGVHLGTYGQGTDDSLVDLIQALSSIEGLARIRLSSIEASHVDTALLEQMASNPKVCRHLHLPLQTGSERTWVRMQRPGTLSRFLAVADAARETVPGIAITTDIMVGFPGEDEAAFAQTLEVIDRVGFEKLHVFRYSARVGTPAAGYSEQVAHEVRRERSKVVRELGDSIRRRWLDSLIGSRVPVLVEKAVADGIVGHTDSYALVRFGGSADSVGQVREVDVSSRSRGTLLGADVGSPW
jgi:threonylcarbamoyladenosine tRNA methylthiotransferase MtaB